MDQIGGWLLIFAFVFFVVIALVANDSGTSNASRRDSSSSTEKNPINVAWSLFGGYLGLISISFVFVILLEVERNIGRWLTLFDYLFPIKWMTDDYQKVFWVLCMIVLDVVVCCILGYNKNTAGSACLYGFIISVFVIIVCTLVGGIIRGFMNGELLDPILKLALCFGLCNLGGPSILVLIFKD